MSSSEVAAEGGTREPGETNRRRRRLCVCTRIHQNNADRPVDLAKVREFLDTALLYADSIAIAVGSPPPPSPAAAAAAAADATADPVCPAHRPNSEDKSPAPHHHQRRQQPSLLELISRVAKDAEGEAPPRSRGGPEGVAAAATDGGDGRAGGGRAAAAVRVFEVAPWGKVTPALNALLAFAARDGAELVMFQSLETTVGRDAVSDMKARMEPEDLVVGAALTGHEFRAGEIVELTGVSTPWNTLALWDVAKLARLGFLAVAEGLLPGVPAGVEEVTAIAALQALLGAEHARAKLVRLPQVQWQTAWEDEARRQWHESKMASKLERAEKQMLALSIKKGVVHHLA